MCFKKQHKEISYEMYQIYKQAIKHNTKVTEEAKRRILMTCMLSWNIWRIYIITKIRKIKIRNLSHVGCTMNEDEKVLTHDEEM